VFVAAAAIPLIFVVLGVLGLFRGALAANTGGGRRFHSASISGVDEWLGCTFWYIIGVNQSFFRAPPAGRGCF